MPVPNVRAIQKRLRRYPFAFVPFAVSAAGALAGIGLAWPLGTRIGVGATAGALGLLLAYALVRLEPITGRSGLRRRPIAAWLAGCVLGVVWMLFWSRVFDGWGAAWLGPGAFGASAGAAVGVSWWELIVGKGIRRASARDAISDINR